MKCRDIERWLDRGMPESERMRAMRHVAVCGACFEAFEAASGLEAALRAEVESAEVGALAPGGATPAASSEFVANVMARVAAAESLALGARLERRRSRYWIALVTDPISICSITAALLIGVWTWWRPTWALDAGMNLAARWWLSAAALAPSGRIALEPVLWVGIAIAVSPLVLWGGWMLYRRVERAILLLASRPGV